jgi:hypothetical protein
MRTRSLLTWGCLGLLLGACGSEAGAERTATTTTPASVETRLVVVSPEANTIVTIAPDLIERCVGYVPFAATHGNFYMHAIWEIAEENLDKLRAVCEEMGHTDPEGLQRISDEKQAVDRFFAALTSTTVAGAAVPTSSPSGVVTIPGAPGCPAGSVMTGTGHCQAATP